VSEVKVTQADREAAQALVLAVKQLACSDPENATKIVMLSVSDLERLASQSAAFTRQSATTEALAAMEQALTAIKNLREWVYGWDASFLSDADWPADDKQARDAVTSLTAAIATLEGDTK
jgi:hypothetical protein